MIIWPGCRPFVSSSSCRKPVGHARELAVAAAGRLHLVDGDGDRLGQRRVVLRRRLAGDAEHLGLRLVQQVHRVALGLVAELRDVRARLDEPAEHGLLGDDLRVVAGVRRGGDDVRERVEVGLAARALHVAGAPELVADRDRVGGLAPRVEAQDRLEDDLVLRHVEVGADDHLEHVGHRVGRQQHAADGALLRQQVVRRRALLAAGRLVPRALRRGRVPLRHRHAGPTPPSHVPCTRPLRAAALPPAITPWSSTGPGHTTLGTGCGEPTREPVHGLVDDARGNRLYPCGRPVDNSADRATCKPPVSGA